MVEWLEAFVWVRHRRFALCGSEDRIPQGLDHDRWEQGYNVGHVLARGAGVHQGWLTTEASLPQYRVECGLSQFNGECSALHRRQ